MGTRRTDLEHARESFAVLGEAAPAPPQLNLLGRLRRLFGASA